MSPEANMYDSHMHTVLCKHARGTPADYAREAERKGLRGITFTCHSPMPADWDPYPRMTIEQLPQYVDMIEAARVEFTGRVDVRLGMESDYFPGLESWIEDLHSKADFSCLLGSVHPLTAEYKTRYLRNSTRLAYEDSYFQNLARAAESGLYDCLSHPDIVKIAHPKAYKVSDHIDRIRRVLDRVAKTGVAMELNTSGVNKPYPEMNPGMAILREMAARDIPVVLGSDSHDAYRVGADFDKALHILEEAGYRTVSYYLERRRCDLQISEARLRRPQLRLL